MPKSDALNYVRRRDRAVEDDRWITTFITHAPVGVLASVENGQPFINSNIFAYDAATHRIYLHTAKAGRTRDTLKTPVPVCFSIMEMGRLLPAPEAREFSVEYAGVVVFGTGQVIDEPEECRHALQLIMDKYAPHLQPDIDYTTTTDHDLKITAVFRVTIDSWSGKKKEVADNFEGAYWFPQSPILASNRR